MLMKNRTREDKVEEFQKAMGQSVGEDVRSSLLDLRAKLILEETAEVEDAIDDMLVALEFGKPVTDEQWEHLLKEAVDLQYVLSGMLVSFKKLRDVDFDVAFNRVHESNMSKLDDNGKPIKNEAGKVLKGPNYKEANMKGLIK